MSYEVVNRKYNIVITLNTNSNYTSGLYLRVYLNNNSFPQYKHYVYNNGKFIVTCSDFIVGDVIRKFEIVQSGSIKLWNTHEGVQILLNGEIITPTLTKTSNYCTFPLEVKESGVYDLQAVFVGNNALQMAKTDKLHYIVTEETAQESSGTPQNPKYSLKWKDKTTPSSLKYNDGTKLFFELMYGGEPVPNQDIQRVMGGNGIGTAITNEFGRVHIQNTGLKCGKWQFGAYFYDESTGERISSGFRTITIEKDKPTLVDNFVKDKKGNDTNFIKGSKYVVYLEHNKKAVTDAKLDMYVNGKKSTKTTAKNGAVTFPFQTKGTYKLKTVYKGSDTLDKVELTRTITISE